MGNSIDPQQKRENAILDHPKKGEPSPFYWACRNGDVDTVRTLLESIDYSQLNELEPNGSTALHAAVHNGHTEIVRILLQEKGVMCHRCNRYGVTAYEEAEKDEIRVLFDRPGNSQRFCNDAAETDRFIFREFQDKSLEENESHEDNDGYSDGYGEFYNDWLFIATSQDAVHENEELTNVLLKDGRSSMIRKLLSFMLKSNQEQGTGIVDLMNEDKAIQMLEQVIDEKVSPSHKDYAKAHSFISLYKATGDITHLLHLYTLETPFYSNLTETNSFFYSAIIFLKLDRLQNRTFQGKSYRGLSMFRDDQTEDLYRIYLENFVSDCSFFALIKFAFQEYKSNRELNNNK